MTQPMIKIQQRVIELSSFGPSKLALQGSFLRAHQRKHVNTTDIHYAHPQYVNETLNGASIGAYHFQSCQWYCPPLRPATLWHFLRGNELVTLTWRMCRSSIYKLSKNLLKCQQGVTTMSPPCKSPQSDYKDRAKYWSWWILLIYFWLQIGQDLL